MAVIKSTESEEYASILFLQWLTEAERNIRFAIQTGYLPVKKEAIASYMDKSELQYTSINKAVLRNAIKEIEESKLYTAPGFLKSYEVRNVLNTSMLTQAEKDYDEIRVKVASGKSKEDVLQEYVSNEHFEEWYAVLSQSLTAIGAN